MMNWANRSVLSLSAAAVLAGCGGPQPPVGAQGTVPQGAVDSIQRAHHAGSSSYKVLYNSMGFQVMKTPLAA